VFFDSIRTELKALDSKHDITVEKVQALIHKTEEHHGLMVIKKDY
jgi:hypothetical protein